MRTREVLANAIDVVKGAALILAFLGVIAICAAWIQIWDLTWQAAVAPVRGAIIRHSTQSPWAFVPAVVVVVVAVSGLSADLNRAGEPLSLSPYSWAVA